MSELVIVLVEDEPAVRSLLRSALARQNFEVLEASDGVEALRLFDEAEDEIDVVVSDVQMPRMSGPQLAQQLRRRKPALRIVFMSGHPLVCISGGEEEAAIGWSPATGFTPADRPLAIPSGMLSTPRTTAAFASAPRSFRSIPRSGMPNRSRSLVIERHHRRVSGPAPVYGPSHPGEPCPIPNNDHDRFCRDRTIGQRPEPSRRQPPLGRSAP